MVRIHQGCPGMRNPGLESGTGIPDQIYPGRDGNPERIRDSNICEIITLKTRHFYLRKLKEPRLLIKKVKSMGNDY